MTVERWGIDEVWARHGRLPAAPGVYVFLGADGRPVYVGKSANLRARLAQYARAVGGRGDSRRKEGRIVASAESVRIERTGSEFAALLRELDLIQEHRPRWNRRMASPEKYVFVEVDYAGEFPRIAVGDDGGGDRRYLGPFLHKRRVERVVSALNDAFALRTCEPMPDEACWRMQTRRCTAPCVGEVSAGDYGRQLLLVREALLGRGRAARRGLRSERDRHTAAERFEAAGRYQKRIEALDAIGKVLFASALGGRDALIVQPGVDDGVVTAWAVVGGAVRDCAEAGDAEPGGIYRRLRRSMATAATSEPTPKKELDRRCIVHAWIRDHDQASGVVATAGVSEAGIRKAFADAVEATRWEQGLFARAAGRHRSEARGG